ncbi:uncharacterized protein MONBRDRAFT_30345 [Monosiga brevicollis MX1]|uniref:MORN repeat-containing protein n=1 Tax=Monosiga brevicollis TaxID=81824 RepID=A9VDQ1_MONBE|nr:uncharacterized protein MONBRDRAFT_30345 [Monosiga brevicollis MX1]EDQ84360.1 predicted protein [Monosiga brevicollis MX1]|eukprot:XP_001750856.1 hypothetical protein [Monosiga brevicollis MX1]
MSQPVSSTMTRRRSVIDTYSDGRSAVRLENGNSYIGGWQDGKFHGAGELVGADGLRYKGQFQLGQFHGRGTLTTKAGTFDGEFQNNKMHGQGAFKYADGSSYTGSYNAGIREGQGQLTLPDGSHYKGPFKVRSVAIPPPPRQDDPALTQMRGAVSNDKQEGVGVLVLADGSKYEGAHLLVKGNFVKGALEGPGVMSVPDGRAYEGEFVGGKPHGQGKLTLPDGSHFEGAFVSDNRQGPGVLKSKRAGLPPFTYDGLWKNDKRHGRGKLTFETEKGSLVFDGEFDNGRPLEGGTMTWPDGHQQTLKVEERFAAYLGPGSHAFGWELALLKVLEAQRAAVVSCLSFI